jgi:hypothetical protein
MATTNLITKTFGKVEFTTGNGYPDHIAPIGSYYINIDDNRVYVNLTGNSNGWSSVSKNNNAELYVLNNSTATITATNSWVALEASATMSEFSNGFTYSSQNLDFLNISEGGFENTITTGTQGFTDNGWIVLNGDQTNKWYVGSTGASGSGFGAYVSGNNGASNTYANTTSVVYFYRDVIIEPFVSNITLSFAIRVGGEANFDRAFAYIQLTPTTFTPGTLLSGFLSQYSLLTGYPERSVSTNVPFSNATQSVRIAFAWQNDGTIQTSPVAASIDNVRVISNPILSLTYTGEESKFRSVLTGSFFSPVATAIATASLQISKNSPDETLPISSYGLAASTVREGFVVQNFFTMSNGDRITPLLKNQLSNISVTFNDLRLRVWEID